MKTAIWLPAHVRKSAAATARMRGISREKLYEQAIAAYLGERTPDQIKQILDELYAEKHGTGLKGEFTLGHGSSDAAMQEW